MRALRASAGYAGCTLRIRLPSLMCEIRNGATLVGGRTGKIGRVPLSNKLRTPVRSPAPVSWIVGADTPTVGGASLPSVAMLVGILDGIVKMMSAGVFGARLFVLACILAV